MTSKCLLILLDGLGDRTHSQLEHKTPLMAADTPVLDSLARKGACGLFHPGLLGQAFSSEKAHFRMFGYPDEFFPGRGVLEALGAGLDLKPDQVVLLAHFVSLKNTDKGVLLQEDSPDQLTQDQIDILSKVVEKASFQGIDFQFIPTKGRFGVIVLSGEVTRWITDCCPMLNDRLLQAIRPIQDHKTKESKSEFGELTASALTSYLSWVHMRLDNHQLNQQRKEDGLLPINGLVTQRAGQILSVPDFRSHTGLQGLSLSSGGVYNGLGRFLQMEVLQVKDSDNTSSDIAYRLRKAKEKIKDFDFIHLHSKAPDEAGHSRNCLQKKEVIERLDEGLGKEIDSFLNDPEVLVVVTADHSTPSSGTLIHSGEPVPVLFCGHGVRVDQVKSFDEISAATGSLSLVRGNEFMYLILNSLDRIKLEGLMDTPVNQMYWPGDYEPFILSNR